MRGEIRRDESGCGGGVFNLISFAPTHGGHSPAGMKRKRKVYPFFIDLSMYWRRCGGLIQPKKWEHPIQFPVRQRQVQFHWSLTVTSQAGHATPPMYRNAWFVPHG